MTFNPGMIIRMTEIEKAAIEFFEWFNKTYQVQPSTHPDHPWNQLGMAICNRDLSGQDVQTVEQTPQIESTQVQCPCCNGINSRWC